jgi:predicted GNAT family N-acyltransferase
MADKITVKKADGAGDLENVFAIRRQVFVDEQKVPAQLEQDAEEESNHFLAFVDGEPAGAARWRRTEKGYKLERFAVLKKFRKMGVGQQILKKIMEDLPVDAYLVYVHAQMQACSFYEPFDFEKTGPEFEEAGIGHYLMIWKRPLAVKP